MSGQDVFTEVSSLSKKLITDMLVRMIESAEDYHSWSLSDEDGARVIKLIRHKQRIIGSSFTFQMNKNFNEFKLNQDAPARKNDTPEWHNLGIPGANADVEITELQGITSRYAEAFTEFDRAILKRLQACIKRSRASIYDNPLQVRRLYECFQYAIDSLNLEVSYKIALYHLFADRFVEALGPFYRRVDSLLLEHGMMPDIPPARIHLRSIENLSESEGPASLKPGKCISLLMLLQGLKEKSRLPSSSFKNLFPELGERLARNGIDEYDDQIEQLNLIFKLIFEDEDLPLPIKQQLARLQIYVFITATQEDGFLRRSSNPARRLLDGIIGSEVEIAKSGNAEFSGVRYIRDQIDAMASREFITVDSYAEMLEGYKAFLKENEAATRKARRIEATKKIMPRVKSRLGEIIQPLKIQGTPLILFEKVWMPLLVQVALTKGMESETWDMSIEMVKKQVWSLIPKSTPEEQEELRRALPQVAHSLHRAMRSLRLADSLQRSLRDYLKLEQQNVLEETARNVIEAKRKTRSLAAQSFSSMDDTTEFDAMMQTGVFQVPTDMLEAMNSNKKQEPERINQVKELNVGEWINLNRGSEKQLAKLAWKSEDSNLYIFVDRDGIRVCEVDATELAQMFESGEVSLMNSAADSEKTRVSFLKSI